MDAVVRAEAVSGLLKAWKGKGKQVTLSDSGKSDRRDIAAQHGLTAAEGMDEDHSISRKATPMQGRLLGGEQVPTGWLLPCAASGQGALPTAR